MGYYGFVYLTFFYSRGNIDNVLTVEHRDVLTNRRKKIPSSLGKKMKLVGNVGNRLKIPFLADKGQRNYLFYPSKAHPFLINFHFGPLSAFSPFRKKGLNENGIHFYIN